MTTTTMNEAGTAGRGHNPLDTRLHDISWGLLITLTGIIWLLPDQRASEGAWLAGVAAILLGVNVVRYFNHIQTNGFSMMLGLAALLAALTRLWRPDLPLLAICFIVIGVSLTLKPLVSKAS